MLRYSDLPIENALREVVKNRGNIGEGSSDFDRDQKRSYFLCSKRPCKISSKSNKNCDRIGARIDR